MGPDIEYEFPCYNRLSHPTDVWSPPVDDDLLHGGVLLKMSSTYCSSFSVMFPRFQALLRRHCNAKGDLAYDLSQWLRGSRITCYSQGEVEALVRLEEADQDAFEIRVRGGRVDARSCFFLLEEVLGVVDQVCRVSLSADGECAPLPNCCQTFEAIKSHLGNMESQGTLPLAGMRWGGQYPSC